jgi:ATP-dependent HslUV protease ATP-binding subunit HslU
VKVQAQGGTNASAAPADSAREEAPPLSRTVSGATRDALAARLASKELEETMIEIELAEDPMFDAGYGFDSFDDFGPPFDVPPARRIRRVSVKEARRLLTRDEANKLIDWDQVAEEGTQRAEQTAVVFIDATRSSGRRSRWAPTSRVAASSATCCRSSRGRR